MIKHKKYQEKGFTLVEILIATLIFSIIMTVLFSSFKAFVLSSEAVKESVLQTEAFQSVIKRMKLDLEAIYITQPPFYKKPELHSKPDSFRFSGKENRFFFASLAHTPFGKNGKKAIARISYYLKENQDHTFDLYRADLLPPLADEKISSCSDPVVCRGVSGFEVLYVDHKGDGHKEWDSEAQSFNYSFPARIDLKIIFGFKDKKQILETSLKVPVERRLSE